MLVYRLNSVPLNIKNPQVERLATEVANLAHETKTEAIRRSLAERKARLQVRRSNASKRARLDALLEGRIWPTVPRRVLGKTITKDEEERILGYGPGGY
jgi:antitoxin VapB